MGDGDEDKDGAEEAMGGVRGRMRNRGERNYGHSGEKLRS